MSPTGSDLSAPYTPYDPASSGNLFDLDATAFPSAVMSFDEQDAFEQESIMRALWRKERRNMIGHLSKVSMRLEDEGSVLEVLSWGCQQLGHQSRPVLARPLRRYLVLWLAHKRLCWAILRVV